MRADAGEAIGAGHLMRSLALAEGLRGGGAEPVFVTRTSHAGYLGEIARRGFRHVSVPGPVAVADEPALMAGLGPADAVAAAVVDRYGLPDDYFLRLRTLRPAWKLAHIDDLGAGFQGVDLVVNQNLGADALSYPRGVSVLAGSPYALLRSEFRTGPRLAFAVRPRVSRVLVTLGGGDCSGPALRVLAALDGFEPGAEVHVVAGHGLAAAALRAFAADRPWIRIRTDVADMCGLMRQMDVSINGAGSTLWELCYVGLPNILYVLADNQARAAEAAAALACSLALGRIEAFEPAPLRAALRRLIDAPEERRRMSERARQAVDGRGVDRVTRALLSLCLSGVAA
jgi:UDP-2,4-diacetamido-2,4,6-trideoxy-beta-L-altropyranose hydrolase